MANAYHATRVNTQPVTQICHGYDGRNWITWRMDGDFHAHVTVKRFDSESDARADAARSVRFIRSLNRI